MERKKKKKKGGGGGRKGEKERGGNEPMPYHGHKERTLPYLTPCASPFLISFFFYYPFWGKKNQ